MEDGTDTWTTEAEARTVLEAAEAADKADRERVPFVPTVVRVPHGARLDCDQVEHREKYSGGHGFYLAQHRNSGWQVRKRGVNKDGGYFVALAKRHEHIVKRGKPVPAPVATGGNATVTENTEKGGIEIRFPSKPEQVVIDSLKANGWRWSKFAACWWIKASDEARAFAQKVTA